MANAELGRSDCCTPAGGSGPCNVPWYLDRALRRVDHLNYMANGTATYNQVSNEIDGNRPVGTRTAWSGGGAHFLAIIAYLPGDFYGVDDPIYGKSDVSENTFKTAYQGSGTWTHTYYIR